MPVDIGLCSFGTQKTPNPPWHGYPSAGQRLETRRFLKVL